MNSNPSKCRSPSGKSIPSVPRRPDDAFVPERSKDRRTPSGSTAPKVPAFDPALLPKRLYATDCYPPIGRINSYSKPEYLLDLADILEGTKEWNYIRASVFGPLFDLPVRKCSLSGKLVHQMLCRGLYTRKKHELWFVFAGKPFRFSLREFHILTGLPCHQYAAQADILKSQKPLVPKPKKGYWEILFGKDKPVVLIKDIVEWLRADKNLPPASRMEEWRRLRLALIVIVDGIIICSSQPVKASEQVVEMVRNLETFELFPWGRESFLLTMRMVKVSTKVKSRSDLISKFNQSHSSTHGFTIAFQLLMFKAIPALEKYLPDSDDEQTFADRSVLQLAPLKTFHNSNIMETEKIAGLDIAPLLPWDGDARIFHWVDEVADPALDYMESLIGSRFNFTKDVWSGGYSKWPPIMVDEKGKEEKVSRARKAPAKRQTKTTDIPGSSRGKEKVDEESHPPGDNPGGQGQDVLHALIMEQVEQRIRDVRAELKIECYDEIRRVVDIDKKLMKDELLDEIISNLRYGGKYPGSPKVTEESPVAKSPKGTEKSPVAKSPKGTEKSTVAKSPKGTEKAPVTNSPRGGEKCPPTKSPRGGEKSSLSNDGDNNQPNPTSPGNSKAKDNNKKNIDKDKSASPVLNHPSSSAFVSNEMKGKDHNQLLDELERTAWIPYGGVTDVLNSLKPSSSNFHQDHNPNLFSTPLEASDDEAAEGEETVQVPIAKDGFGGEEKVDGALEEEDVNQRLDEDDAEGTKLTEAAQEPNVETEDVDNNNDDGKSEDEDEESDTTSGGGSPEDMAVEDDQVDEDLNVEPVDDHDSGDEDASIKGVGTSPVVQGSLGKKRKCTSEVETGDSSHQVLPSKRQRKKPQRFLDTPPIKEVQGTSTFSQLPSEVLSPFVKVNDDLRKKFMSSLKAYRQKDYLLDGHLVPRSFFKDLHTSHQPVHQEHVDAMLSLLWRKLGDSFVESRAALLDTWFSVNVCEMFPRFKKSKNKSDWVWSSKFKDYVVRGIVPGRYNRQAWLTDVDTLYAPFHLPDGHWVSLVIDLKEYSIAILDSNVGGPAEAKQMDNMLKPLSVILPSLIKDLVPQNIIETPVPKEFAVDRMPEIFQSEDIGDSGPLSVKFIELHLQAISHDVITEEMVANIRLRFAVDIYEDLMGLHSYSQPSSSSQDSLRSYGPNYSSSPPPPPLSPYNNPDSLGIPKMCFCGGPVHLVNSITEADPGRRFYQCEMRHGPGRHIFKWWDEALMDEICAIRSSIREQDEHLKYLITAPNGDRIDPPSMWERFELFQETINALEYNVGALQRAPRNIVDLARSFPHNLYIVLAIIVPISAFLLGTYM
ncbi:Ulp1 protease family C-terminal catalytic domain [Arabidopsis thaliana x Arabidopsis arenosa]|uniref:Ulp1 protease family C-terminal catalytic domain n=1 Tax=Arabidopsis thaliana x Arabidopsis arenosa TaxID=1240361 RepID=A0A8T2CIB5_9BRAS|nr:Ulp1 protease family C-terminal catalytic domain [Arabidopsis thaliana x Arabidopsis arenosa]